MAWLTRGNPATEPSAPKGSELNPMTAKWSASGTLTPIRKVARTFVFLGMRPPCSCGTVLIIHKSSETPQGAFNWEWTNCIQLATADQNGLHRQSIHQKTRTKVTGKPNTRNSSSQDCVLSLPKRKATTNGAGTQQDNHNTSQCRAPWLTIKESLSPILAKSTRWQKSQQIV